MTNRPTMRPDQSKNPGEDYENTVASETGWDGPHPRPRDKRPEAQYPQHDREVGVNRTGTAAPKGPVNIPVKGGAAPAEPEAAAGKAPSAPNGGGRDAPQD